jgi:hypothetical protein
MSDIQKAFLEKKPPREESSKKPFFALRKKRDLTHIGRASGRKPFLVIFLWAIFLATASYALIFSPFDRIDSTTVAGTHDISEHRIRQFVSREISGKYLKLFPKDTFFLIRKSRIESRLLEAFPKISMVTIETRFPRSMDIMISERDRLLLWCSAGPCFLLGDDGEPKEARFTEEAENTPFVLSIVDESARPVKWGESVLSADDIDSFFHIEKSLREDLRLDPSPVTMTPSGVSREVRFRVGEGWDVFVDLSLPSEKTIATLKLLLTKELLVEKRPNLRYVDLRTENRAFYAWKDAPAPAVITPQADAVPPKEERKKRK